MSGGDKSVYASAPFKFIVDGEPFYIHADLVSFHSKPLDRLINGQMSEAQKGYATLEDVDEGTFVRFIEWAHRGHYTAADFTRVEIEEPPPDSRSHNIKTEEPRQGLRNRDFIEVATPPQQTVQFDWGPAPEPPVEDAFDVGVPTAVEAEPELDWPRGFGRSHKKSKKSKKDFTPENKRELKEAFIRRKYTVRQDVFQVPPPRENRSPDEDYTDVLLSHAHLYVFADKYDIQALKELALDELHAILAIYTLYPTRTGDIIALLRYAYSNTSDSADGAEDLRTLLTQYMGIEMDTLIDDGGFKDLMIEDGGPLLGDFMRMVGRRIAKAD